jgi:hypothetical protein
MNEVHCGSLKTGSRKSAWNTCSVASASVFNLWNIWIGISERVTYLKFAGCDGRKGKGKRGGNLIVPFLFLPSFCGPHTGLSQGHRPKTAEATLQRRFLTSFAKMESHNTTMEAKGKRKYSSYSFTTSALGGVSGQCHLPACSLPPGKEPPVHIGQEAGWASQLVWTQRLEETSFASAGDRTPIVQSVVRHYTDWATPASDVKRWKGNTDEVGQARWLKIPWSYKSSGRK